MNTGMELMGMFECEQCGDPFTLTEDGSKVCGGCKASLEHVRVMQERDTLKARVTELSMERASLVTDLRAAEKRVAKLEAEAEDLTTAYEMARTNREAAEKRAEQAERERDEARPEAAKLRALNESQAQTIDLLRQYGCSESCASGQDEAAKLRAAVIKALGVDLNDARRRTRAAIDVTLLVDGDDFRALLDALAAGGGK